MTGSKGVNIGNGHDQYYPVNTVPNNNLSTINSLSGSVNITGNAREVRDGVFLSNVSLIANAGCISINGTADGEFLWTGIGGVRLQNNVSLTSKNNSLSGINSISHGTDKAAGGVFNVGNFSFEGNTSMNFSAPETGGIVFLSGYSKAPVFHFINGTVSINASSESTQHRSQFSDAVISISAWSGTENIVEFNLSNAVLNISAVGKGLGGIASASDWDVGGRGYKFTGSGGVNIYGKSDSDTGVAVSAMNNTGLTGTFSVTGVSNSGAGVSVDGGGGHVSFGNATINGISDSGSGIVLGDNTNIINTTLCGTSNTSAGINIDGNNVNISNGSTLNGTSDSGAGVQLSGGTNYTIDGTTVTGQSSSGDGVSVGGSLNIT
ncbi:TPA: hypothetical protein ACS50C_005136, partial [Salmonella enterica]